MPSCGPIVEVARDLHAAQDDAAAARELAAEDPAFAEEAADLDKRIEEYEETLRRLLVPRDPNDGKDVIMEIKAGEGGEESALFAGDLLRMYLRLRRARRLEDRDHRRPALRPRWLQRRHRRGEITAIRRGRVGPAEV